jgi:transcriptional regulator with XRE-family HTH domain
VQKNRYEKAYGWQKASLLALGKVMVARRGLLKLTREMVARRANLSTQTVGWIECGTSICDIREIFAIATALGTSTSELMVSMESRLRRDGRTVFGELLPRSPARRRKTTGQKRRAKTA